MNEAVNPLSIDPNERVTPSGHESHNGDMAHGCESIGVSEIGVIPPPPMFSSPSPPGAGAGAGPGRGHIIPPPKEHGGHPGHQTHLQFGLGVSHNDQNAKGEEECERF